MSSPAASHDVIPSGVVPEAETSPAVPVTSTPWAVRAYTARADLPFGVLESWCSLYQRSHSAGCVPNNVADAVWAESVNQLLGRGAVMYVAVNPARPDHWLGYALTERTGDGVPVVHLAFTKPAYRRSGVLRSLLATADIDRMARLFWTFAVGPERKMYPAGRFEPSIARRMRPQSMAKPLKLTNVVLREALDFALPVNLNPLVRGWTGSVDEESGVLVLRFTDDRFGTACGTYRMSVHSPQIRFWRVSGAKAEDLQQ